MMKVQTPRASLGGTVYLVVSLLLGAYFAFAAVQGDSGVLAQRQVAAEAEALMAERDALAAELNQLQNLTLRLSDAFLDLDLLDERARAVLGYIRADEIVLR
jgi:cell division protein FtsB